MSNKLESGKGKIENMKKTTKILLAICLVLLIIVPLITIHSKDGEEIFGGADGAAEELITELDPDYEPWFSNLIEPKSGEIESLLFSLQAAIGAGVIGYGAGYLVGKRKEIRQNDEEEKREKTS